MNKDQQIKELRAQNESIAELRIADCERAEAAEKESLEWKQMAVAFEWDGDILKAKLAESEKSREADLMARQGDTGEIWMVKCEEAEAKLTKSNKARVRSDKAWCQEMEEERALTNAAEKESEELKAQVASLRESLKDDGHQTESRALGYEPFYEHYPDSCDVCEGQKIALSHAPADSLTHWQERVSAARVETWEASIKMLREGLHMTPYYFVERFTCELLEAKANPQEKPNA